MITTEYTDSRCVYAGKARSGVPLLVGSEGFIKPACDYLRYRVIQESLKSSSAKTYAEDLQVFFSFLSRKNVSWKSVTDKVLTQWRDEQDVTDPTKNRRLDCVVAMYIWLEQRGEIAYVVNLPGYNDHKDFTPQITLVEVKHSNPRSKRTTSALKTPLLISTAKSGNIPHTPSDDELSRVCSVIAADSPGVALRNNLLISWYRSAGTRRNEWRSLTVDQIPSWDTIYSYFESGEFHEVLLKKTKNDNPRHVAILPELLEETREYIEGPRAELVERFKQRAGYKEPEEIFLSEKTGQPPRARHNIQFDKKLNGCRRCKGLGA